MMSRLLIASAAVGLMASLTSAACADVSGTFTLTNMDLYPESADWDPKTCKVYISATYNCSLVIYDPSTKGTQVIDIPGITNHGNYSYTEYHLNGVDYDASSGLIWISAGSAAAYTSTDTGDYSHANFTGPNKVIKFDPSQNKVVQQFDLTSVQNAFLSKTGGRTSGFQDLAEDSNGNTFIIGTYGNAIAKIPKGGNSASLWYANSTYNEHYGFGGLFTIGDKLIISDTISGGFVTFNTSASTPKPTYVKLQGLPSNYKPGMADGLIAPSKYGGKIALWSDDFNGTSVYGSKDNWASAHYLGLAPSMDPASAGSLSVASFEAGNSIYAVVEVFQFTLPVKPSNKFPFYDITKQIDDIVTGSKFLN